MRVKVRLVILAGLLSAVALHSNNATKRGGSIVSATFSDIKTLNLFLATDSETAIYSRLMNAGLTWLNPLTQKPEPSLAESWKISADEREITFRLRKNVQWSDGRPFTAEDVLFTMQVVNDDNISSVASDSLRIDGQEIDWIALNSHSVKATLPAKHVTFLRHLDPGTCPIIARHLWEKLYQAGEFSDAMRPAENGVAGLGPFRFKSYAPGQYLTFERNPYYWKVDAAGAHLPYLDQVSFMILANQDQVGLRIENGEIDTYQSIRASDVDRLKQKSERLRLKVENVGPTLDMEGFFFNQNRGADPETKKPYVDAARLSWFMDTNFRRAVSHAIDRKALVNHALFGHGIPAYSPESPSNQFWYNPEIARYDHDLQKAQVLLIKGGFVQKENEKGKPELYDRNGNRVRFSLYTNAGNSIRNTQCLLIASDLAKLGMDVQYSALEFATLLNRINRTFEYDAVLIGLNRDDTDPGGRRNMLLSSGALHFWWPRQEKPFTPWEKRIDELMGLVLSSSEASTRKKSYDEVQNILAEQQPMIFTFHPYGFVCARKTIGNMKPTPFRHRTLWNAEELYWSETADKHR